MLRRRFMEAGLALLGALGLAPLGGPATRLARAERRRLEGSEEWKRLLATWKEAEEIASGKRGSFPFDRAGKDRVLAELGRAQQELDQLVKAGLLAEPAAAILKKDLAVLRAGVVRFRPTEMKLTTCYKPMLAPDKHALSLGRLRERLPLLERLAAGKGLQAPAVEKVLLGIERDLAQLGDRKLAAADARLRKVLERKVAALRTRLRTVR
jgi:hypothetical protein